MTNGKTNRHLIDQIGDYDAQIADLQKKKKILRDQIAAKGPGSYEGDQYRATVSYMERETLDMEAVRAKLTPRWIKAHTKVTEVITVRITARNGLNLKGAA